jgi:hypothetical protein
MSADDRQQRSSLAQWFDDTYCNRYELPVYRPPGHTWRIDAARDSALYELQNSNPAFIAEIVALFAVWSWSAADEVVVRWGLPRRALKDLEWSRDEWLRRGRRRPRLELGYRSYPGMENDATPADARRLGYGIWPAQVYDPKTYQRRARLFYARVVEQKPWQDIAGAEKSAEHRPIDTKFVRSRVARFAKKIGVLLPKRPPGRPRKMRLK